MIRISILPDRLDQRMSIPLGDELFDVRIYWSEDVLDKGGQVYLDVTHHTTGDVVFVGWVLHAGVIATLPAEADKGIFFCDCVDVEPRFDNVDRWQLWFMSELEFNKWDA